MRILAKYISTTFTANFLLSVSGLTIIYFLQALLGELLNQRYPASQTLTYYLLEIPQVFVMMTPPSVLMATVLTLAGLSRTNELVACYSIGIGLNRIMAVLLVLVFMICCFTLIMQDRILPPVFKKRTTYYWQVMKQRPDFFLDFKQDKIWYRSNQLIYNLRHFDPKSMTIYGLTVYAFDDAFNLVERMESKTAEYTPEGWKLKDGGVTTFSTEDGFPVVKSFRERSLQIDESPKDFQEIEKKVEGLRLKELWTYIQRNKGAGIDTKVYETTLHSRISLSFIPFVMCILAVPFSVSSRRAGGVGRDLALGFGLTFFYWLLYSVGISLGNNGALPPWVAAWLASAVFLVFALSLIGLKRQ